MHGSSTLDQIERARRLILGVNHPFRLFSLSLDAERIVMFTVHHTVSRLQLTNSRLVNALGIGGLLITDKTPFTDNGVHGVGWRVAMWLYNLRVALDRHINYRSRPTGSH